MKCPTCVAEGLKSRIFVSPVIATRALAFRSYYVDGRYHAHDPNPRTESLRCSQGHEFMRSVRPRCPAGDYGGRKRAVVEPVGAA